MEAPSWLPFMLCPGITAAHFIEKDLLPGKAPTIPNGTRLRTPRCILALRPLPWSILMKVICIPEVREHC